MSAGCGRYVVLLAGLSALRPCRGVTNIGNGRFIYHLFVVMWRAQSARFGHVLRSLPDLPSPSVTRVIRKRVIVGDFRGPPCVPIRKCWPGFSGPTPRPVSCLKSDRFAVVIFDFSVHGELLNEELRVRRRCPLTKK